MGGLEERMHASSVVKAESVGLGSHLKQWENKELKVALRLLAE